jgi:hypothetical protein
MAVIDENTKVGIYIVSGLVTALVTVLWIAAGYAARVERAEGRFQEHDRWIEKHEEKGAITRSLFFEKLNSIDQRTIRIEEALSPTFKHKEK